MQQPCTRAGTPARSGPGQGGATREFPTFRLGAEHYGIDILRGQEIRRYERPTQDDGPMLILLDIERLLTAAELAVVDAAAA